MNKLLVVLLAALSVTHVAKAQPIKLFVEQRQGLAVVYAQNDEVAPHSIVLKLNLENMSFLRAVNPLSLFPLTQKNLKLAS